MRLKGHVREWRDEKGFGFVEPMLPGPSVFVHIKSFTRPGRRPQFGDLLTYEMGRDPNGRPRAERVEFSHTPETPQRIPSKAHPRVWVMCFAGLFIGGLVLAAAIGKAPFLIPAIYAAMSALAFVLYAWDKVSARGGRWRTKESTLLLVGLLGGWPGALIAQEQLRHKNVKASFQAAYWGSVIINVTAVCWCYANNFRFLETM